MKREPGKKYIASLSYGKDSLAMLEAIHRLGYPLDEIVHTEIWATDDIPAEFPEMIDFKEHADKIIKERYGLDVTRICAMKDGDKWTFEKHFYTKKKKGKYKDIYGFPTLKGSWCIDLKVNPLGKKTSDVQYIGIAVDETNRINRKQVENKVLPLVDIGWTEEDCMNWCKENDLVSPIYQNATRGGCWFCGKQPIPQLRLLRKNYPDLWKLLLDWDHDSPTKFEPHGHTVHDLDKRFAAEDARLVPTDRRFRWKMLDEL